MYFSLRLLSVLTFVLTAIPTLAAPVVSPTRAPASKAAEENQKSTPMMEGLDLDMPRQRPATSEFLLDIDDFKQFFSSSLGLRIHDADEDPVTVLTFAYHQKHRVVHTLSSGVDLALNGTSFIYGGYGYLVHSRDDIRAEFFSDLGVKVVPTDGLATFIKAENWLIRPGIAINYHWYARHSFRAEASLGLGTNHTENLFNLGYVWSWR